MKRKINMNEQVGTSLKTVCEAFIISQSSKGVLEATIKNYHSHLKGIAKHLDIEMPFETLTKRQLEQMVVSMRGAGLAHNTAAAYLRVLNTFLRWCQRKDLTDVSIPNIREKDTVSRMDTGVLSCPLHSARVCPCGTGPLVIRQKIIACLR